MPNRYATREPVHVLVGRDDLPAVCGSSSGPTLGEGRPCLGNHAAGAIARAARLSLDRDAVAHFPDRRH